MIPFSSATCNSIARDLITAGLLVCDIVRLLGPFVPDRARFERITSIAAVRLRLGNERQVKADKVLTPQQAASLERHAPAGPNESAHGAKERARRKALAERVKALLQPIQEELERRAEEARARVQNLPVPVPATVPRHQVQSVTLLSAAEMQRRREIRRKDGEKLASHVRAVGETATTPIVGEV